jgi:hypothetical protein
MVRRSPKSIGTHAESAVLRQLKPYWPEARREVLHGHRDIGDIVGCGQMMFEVKGGDKARTAGPELVSGWLAETERERQLGGARFGILVMQRSGYGEDRADRWWAVLYANQFSKMLGGETVDEHAQLRMELGDLLRVMADLDLTATQPELDASA